MRHNKLAEKLHKFTTCDGKLYSLYVVRKRNGKIRFHNVGKICSKCCETIIDKEKVKSLFKETSEIKVQFIDE